MLNGAPLRSGLGSGHEVQNIDIAGGSIVDETAVPKG